MPACHTLAHDDRFPGGLGWQALPAADAHGVLASQAPGAQSLGEGAVAAAKAAVGLKTAPLPRWMANESRGQLQVADATQIEVAGTSPVSYSCDDSCLIGKGIDSPRWGHVAKLMSHLPTTMAGASKGTQISYETPRMAFGWGLGKGSARLLPMSARRDPALFYTNTNVVGRKCTDDDVALLAAAVKMAGSGSDASSLNEAIARAGFEIESAGMD